MKKYPANTIYQTRVVQITLTLGQTIINIGDSKGRKDSLVYYDTASNNLVEKAEYFQDLGLKYESFLASRLGLLSKLKYNARVIELEKEPAKRASGYRECALLANKLADIEPDEKQMEKWADTSRYYEGRALVNDSIVAGFNRKMLEKAVEVFKQANSCDEAYPCFCVYNALLKLTEIPHKKVDLQSLKMHLAKTRQRMSKGEATKACFLKIEQAIEKRYEGADIGEIIKELNEMISSIDYSGLREVFKHAAHEVDKYLKNPMDVSVKYQNWHLWGSISGMDGLVKISVRGNVLREAMVKKEIKFSIPFEPENLREDIIFEPLENPHLKRKIPLDCCELVDSKQVFFLKRRAM